MLRHLSKIVAVIVAAVLLHGALITPLVPTFLAVLVGGSELHTMRETGLPASVRALEWTDWRPSDGTLSYTEWAPQSERLKDARILSYRIGIARGTVSKFTFYQARYALADGTEVIAPAEGPELLISPRWPTIIVLVTLQLAAFGILLAYVFGRKRQHAEKTSFERIPMAGRAVATEPCNEEISASAIRRPTGSP